MKFFAALSALIAVASSSAFYYNAAPILIRSAIRPAIQQQYHAQDEFGQYSYGYSEPLSAKQEVKTLDGVTRGSYSYRDAEGKVQTVDYIADAGGFRVAATNLPKPVEVPEFIPAKAPLPVVETPEVAAARSAHLAAIEEAKARSGSALASAQLSGTYNLHDLPRPVEDTPEVARAKVEHLNAIENTKLRNAVIREGNDNLVQGASIIAAASPVRYISGASLPIEYRSTILPSGFSYSHLATIEEAKEHSGSALAPAQFSGAYNLRDLPRPVEDTPEVAHAKVEHLNAVENTKLRNAVIRKDNENSVQGASIIAAASPVRYINGASLPVAYGSTILPSGFAYSYGGLNGALLATSSHYTEQ